MNAGGDVPSDAGSGGGFLDVTNDANLNAPRPIASLLQLTPTSMASDGTMLYWVSSVGPGGPVSAILAIYPFAVTVLFNAALLSIAIPLYLAARNLRSGSFEFPRGFTGYRIPVPSLPDRFVWLRDPTFHPEIEEDDVNNSDDDRKLRERQRDELLKAGATSVWVTPQVPFVVLLAAGAILGVVAGNLAFDAFALL